MLGARPYAEVPAYLQALDVGCDSVSGEHPYVQGINPNKVYQYLAAGPAGRDHALARPAAGAAAPAVRLESWRDGRRGARRAGAPSATRRRGARSRAPHDWDAIAARMVDIDAVPPGRGLLAARSFPPRPDCTNRENPNDASHAAAHRAPAFDAHTGAGRRCMLAAAGDHVLPRGRARRAGRSSRPTPWRRPASCAWASSRCGRTTSIRCGIRSCSSACRRSQAAPTTR